MTLDDEKSPCRRELWNLLIRNELEHSSEKVQNRMKRENLSFTDIP
jgi:hypothetical protein